MEADFNRCEWKCQEKNLFTQISHPQWGTVPHLVLPDAAFLKISGAELEFSINLASREGI